MTVKQCIDCPPGLLKPVTDFWVSRKGRTRDGFTPLCKEHNKLRQRVYNANNRQKQKESNQRRYKKNPERCKKAADQWRSQNPQRARELHRNSEMTRRARKLDQFIEPIDFKIVYEMHGGMCGICKDFVPQDDFHVDHVIPLSKGGMHGYVNVQPSHPSCNLKKAAKV